MAETNKKITDVFSLDTGNFDEIAEKFRLLGNTMKGLKRELDGMKDELMFAWVGEGRNMFEKKYHILSRQFGDLGDELLELAETIYKDEAEYIQADVNASKMLGGKDSRY